MTDTDKQAKITERIAQLLAKAESTTPEEAEALTEAAEKLMVKYMIDQSVIDARRAKAGQASEEIIHERIEFTGAYRLEYAHIGTQVCRSLGAIKNLLDTFGNKKAVLHLIGFQSDVDQAKVLIMSLQVQSVVAVKEWWKINKADYEWNSTYEQEAARRSFVRGFGTGAGKRIKDNRQQQVQEAEQAHTGTELVLVDRAAKVQDHFDGVPQAPRQDRGGKGSYEAHREGHAAGQKANTGERSVGHRKGISA
jgi:hypothetical protein